MHSHLVPSQRLVELIDAVVDGRPVFLAPDGPAEIAHLRRNAKLQSRIICCPDAQAITSFPWGRPRTMTTAPNSSPLLQRLLPVVGWLPAYRRAWLLPDVLAGLTVWAVMVPEGMAYAGIVGVPPIMGLYTIVPPLVAYALLGSSRLLVVGPDTATGLISALTVAAFAAQGSAEFNSLTSTLAILIGAFFLLFGALRMGWVAAFIPTPVMRGFIEGLVCVTIIGQVPHLLGISGASGNFFTKLWSVVQHLSDVSLAPMLTGLLSFIAMQLQIGRASCRERV